MPRAAIERDGFAIRHGVHSRGGIIPGLGERNKGSGLGAGV
jgi:hypothetical protein